MLPFSILPRNQWARLELSVTRVSSFLYGEKTMLTTSSSDGIVCPHCGHVHDDVEEWAGLVNYWGTADGPKSYDCVACDMEFLVQENVKREWICCQQTAASGGGAER